MSIDGIAALVFIILLAVFLFLKRKQVQLQRALFPIIYVIMYRTSFGLRAMNYAKNSRLVKLFGDVSIIAGFLGMLLISVELVWGTVKVFLGEGIPGIQPVLPIEAKGVFFVPFIYWILSIFLLALVHEFAHGIVARAYDIPVKSSGFAFLCLLLPIVPAAFVEPDEKVVQKRPYRQQLGVFAAGSISNLLFALVIFGLFSFISPIVSSAFDATGVELASVTENSPAFNGGLREGDIIQSANNIPIISPQNITSILANLSPGNNLQVATSNSSLNISLGAHPDNNSTAYLGIQAKPYFIPNEKFVASYGAWAPPVLKWLTGFAFWLFMLNIGIGLFNLLPIGPLDGGRMFQLVCLKVFKNKFAATKIWMYVSVFFIILILANIVAGFIH
ncbi:MAG: site-2 protease family protein [Candidatus Woesearchaeota archaeon]|nr:site-2 protease family protein [Candidatus Woesearchaeota archaeon]